jgi:hypothetical protein
VKSRWWKMSFVVALIVLLVIELASVGLEGLGAFIGIPVPGFFAVLGFVGCVAIILISKWLGRYWLQRREDYYDERYVG